MSDKKTKYRFDFLGRMFIKFETELQLKLHTEDLRKHYPEGFTDQDLANELQRVVADHIDKWKLEEAMKDNYPDSKKGGMR